MLPVNEVDEEADADGPPAGHRDADERHALDGGGGRQDEGQDRLHREGRCLWNAMHQVNKATQPMF